MPTGVRVKTFNPTDERVTFNPSYAVLRGDDILPAVPVPAQDPSLLSALESLQPEMLVLTFPEQLPAGTYRLANLDEAGKVTDIFEHTEIEVSAAYDSMVYVPELTGKDFDEAKAILTEKGIVVEKGRSNYSGSYRIGEVVVMEVIDDENCYTDEAGVTHSPFHLDGWDGSGYWLSPDDRVTLDVYTGFTGMDP